jgi:hypothetical protein
MDSCTCGQPAGRRFVGRRFARLALLVVAGTLTSGLFAVSAQAAKPMIENVSAKSITSKRATLEATINPGGLETTYEFQATYAACQGPPGASGCEVIVDARWGGGTIPAGSSGQIVTAVPTQLTPQYVYDYRLVASNSEGEEQSTEKKFTALPAPIIASESTAGVTAAGGTLEAQINPEGQSVYYQFQLVEDPSEYAPELECQGVEIFCKESATPPWLLKIGYLPAGNVDTGVELDLAQVGITLKPGKTYHYRVLVAPSVQTEDTIQWDGPPVDSADQMFTTLEEPVAPTKKGTGGGTGGSGGGSNSGAGSGPPGTGPYQPIYGPPSPGHGHTASGKGHHKSKHPTAHKKHKRHKSKANWHKHGKSRKG